MEAPPSPDGWGIVPRQMDPIHGGPVRCNSWVPLQNRLSVGFIKD